MTNERSEGKVEPRFFVVGLVLLVAALGLAAWGFSKDRLSDHQYVIMRWLLPLASGFGAGAFVGSLTVRSNGILPGLIVTAAGGFGVWLISLMVLKNPDEGHRNGNGLLPDRTVSVKLVSGGRSVPKRFTLRYRFDDQVPHEIEGTDGQVSVNIPSTVSVLKEVTVTVACYTQQKQGPFEIVDGKPVEVEVQPKLNVPPPPLPPTAFPDASNLIPDLAQLKATGREKAAENKVSPGSVLFTYENRTDQFLYLLLYSFDPRREDKPWRELQSDPCQKAQTFNNFTEATGLYAIIARTESGALTYLGHADLYAKSPTMLVIEKSGQGVIGTFR